MKAVARPRAERPDVIAAGVPDVIAAGDHAAGMAPSLQNLDAYT